MSSPLANRNPTAWQKRLMGFHQKSAHSSRIARLAHELGGTIDQLPSTRPDGIRILDVGCGDMTLAETLHTMNPETHWTCTDIHEVPPDLVTSPKWKKYRKFDGRTLPFPDGSFDAVLFSDVLHHCMENAGPLISEALRVGNCVIVKDHFEYGWFSRQVLRLMDFIGNYGYGVRIPDSYFSESTFRGACRLSGAKLSELRVGIDLYSDFPLIRNVIKKEWQFIAVLHPANTHPSLIPND